MLAHRPAVLLLALSRERTRATVGGARVLSETGGLPRLVSIGPPWIFSGPSLLCSLSVSV